MSAAAVPADLEEVRRRHLALLSAGERHAALRAAAQLVEDGMELEDLILGVLAPVQAEIGALWQRGVVTTAQERAATEVADVLLTLAAARRSPSADRARLILCVADREHHNLPARMVAELLRDRGHSVTFIGAARPQAGLEQLLRQFAPDAVVVSCSLPMNLPGAVALADVAHQAGLPVIGGGRGFGAPSWAGRVGLDGHAARIADVEPGVVAAAAAPLRPAPADDRALQHADLAASRLPLAAELADRVLWQAASQLPRPLRDPRTLRDHLGNVLSVLEAAVLVDDRIFADYLTWFGARMKVMRADDRLVPTLLSVAQARLAPDLPAAAAVVARCMT